MENRRVFFKKLNTILFLGSLAFASLTSGFKNILAKPISKDEFKIDKKERNIHIAYFDPAKGYISNPGMGINVYAFSDHMHIGYTREEWKKTESKPHLPIDKKLIDKIEHHPYADNIYIRMEWRDIQKNKGKLEFREAKKSAVILDAGSPHPRERAMLVPIELPRGLQGTKEKMNIKLTINLKIRDKARPVKWAVEQNGKTGVKLLEFPLYPL